MSCSTILETLKAGDYARAAGSQGTELGRSTHQGPVGARPGGKTVHCQQVPERGFKMFDCGNWHKSAQNPRGGHSGEVGLDGFGLPVR